MVVAPTSSMALAILDSIYACHEGAICNMMSDFVTHLDQISGMVRRHLLSHLHDEVLEDMIHVLSSTVSEPVCRAMHVSIVQDLIDGQVQLFGDAVGSGIDGSRRRAQLCQSSKHILSRRSDGRLSAENVVSHLCEPARLLDGSSERGLAVRQMLQQR